MIFGIGIDLIEVARIERDLSDSDRPSGFVAKVFTPAEIGYCERFKDKALNYAARFAAKEAMLKAMGTGLREKFQLKEMEVVNDELGKPSLVVHGAVRQFLERNGIHSVHLTLSHVKETAAAFVILER